MVILPFGFMVTSSSPDQERWQMAKEVETRNSHKSRDLQDHIVLKLGGVEAKISGFKIAAFTVVALCVLGWLIL